MNLKSAYAVCRENKAIAARLCLIDILYLLYLTGIAGLAVSSGRSALHVVAWHAGIGLLIILLAANRNRSKTVRFLHDWYPLAMFIFSFEEIARFSLALIQRWQDVHVIAFEQWLFSASPNVWLAQFASRFLSEFMDAGYFSYYPLFPVVAGVLYSRPDKRRFHDLVLASVLMYLISFTIYLTFPMEGPRKALSAFHVPPAGWLFSWIVRTIQGGAGVHGNALPSSHVALAVLCTLAAYRGHMKVAPFVAASTGLICVGAVYDGYHYLADVLAAIAVALIAGGIAATTTRLKNTPQ